MAEWLSYLDRVERVDASTIRHSTESILGVSRFLEFVSAARTALG
jgi:D-aminopeptidase